MALKTEQIIEAAAGHKNIVELLGAKTLDSIGADAVQGYTDDKLSRHEWETRNADAMRLALQVVSKKTTPWENASNVKFPLLTIGAIQFAARAYPSLVNGTAPVKCRALGSDPTGEKLQRAERIGRHMSYQLLEEDEDWEAETDRALMTLPIIGNTYKKSYFDPEKDHNVSEHVLVHNLVVDYYTKSLDTCRRITHVMEKHISDIKTSQRMELYADVDLANSGQIAEPDDLQRAKDDSQGVTPPERSESGYRVILEQHTWLDLDDDGIEEPYILVVDKDTRKVLRITSRIRSAVYTPDEKVAKFFADSMFTKYGFIPSPDGGFMDLGFGSLLGPLNESVNTLINQLIDSGTLNNLQSGFLGRGIRVKGGATKFKPGEWKTLLSTGDDIRKGLLPLPTKEPSNVLFSLLGMLVSYGERMSSATDMMVGESPGQNQAATTTMAVVEQGMKVYTGIFKRLFRCMKGEYQKLYLLNRKYLNPQQYFQLMGSEGAEEVYAEDYSGDEKAIVPAADPNIVSDAQRIKQAEALAARAAQVPGYNTEAVERRLIEAYQIPGGELLYDPKANPPQQNPQLEIEKQKLQIEAAKIQAKAKEDARRFELDILESEAKTAKLRTAALLDIARADNLDEESKLKSIALIAKEISDDDERRVRRLEAEHKDEGSDEASEKQTGADEGATGDGGSNG